MVGLHAWPSPFSGDGVLHIAFAAPGVEGSGVPPDLDLGLFDVLGRRVATLATGSAKREGDAVHLEWDSGAVRTGNIVPGIYFLRASAPSVGLRIEGKVAIMR
jgi:hypothetical protein